MGLPLLPANRTVRNTAAPVLRNFRGSPSAANPRGKCARTNNVPLMMPGGPTRWQSAMACGASKGDRQPSWVVGNSSTTAAVADKPDGKQEADEPASEGVSCKIGSWDCEVTKPQALKALAEFCGLVLAAAAAATVVAVGFQPALTFLESCNEVVGFGSVAVALFMLDRVRTVQRFVGALDDRVQTMACYIRMRRWQANIITSMLEFFGIIARALLLLFAVEAAVEAIVPDDMLLKVPERLAGILGEAGAVVTGNDIEAVIIGVTRKIAYAALMLNLGAQLFSIKNPPPGPFLSPKDGLLAKFFLATQGKLPGKENIKFVGVCNLINRVLDVVISIFIATRVLGTFGVELKAILAVAGVGALAISFAARPLVQNLISGLLIFLTNPFTVGDKITVNGITGNIERIGWVHTQIITEDGLPYMAPNDVLASASVVNKSRIDIATPIKIPVILSPSNPGTENVEGAIQSFEKLLKSHPQIDASQMTAVHYKGTINSGAGLMFHLSFSLNVSVPPIGNRDQKMSEIMTDVYQAAQKNGLGAVAHPQ